MKKLIYILFIATLLFTSCDEYLDEKPDRNKQEIEYVSDINLLLDQTYGGFISDINFSNTGGDQTYYQGVYNFVGRWLYFPDIQESVWKDDMSSVNNSSWTNAYEAIWFTNFVINSIGSLEGDADEKANLIAEVHLIKAYKQFNLALKHCLYPSSANAEEMGIPLKNETEFGLTTVRASLGETFEQIEADLIEGLKIDKPRTDSWRESDASAAALAARIYLYMHDFDKAKQYAEKAVSLHSTMINVENIELSRTYDGTYTASTSGILAYSKEFYSSWESQYKIYYDGETGYYMTPSANLLAAYEPTDLRLQYFYSDALFSTYYGLTENNMLYTRNGTLMTGTDVAEMYLILAECAARNNDFTTCMQNVELVRVNRFAAADYTSLPVPSSEKDAVELIANERWREFPFTSLRWYDVKRLNAEGLVDPIILSKDYFEVGETAIDFGTPKVYTLEPNSRKYARPIPKEVISLTRGSVVQNTY
ncbi:RagB/SusD family nutrient uptake outer membrane protein [Ancylomarina sp. 16SWW S1-10-2]|uniref:RagB/SusD family nutrient uptake outer membrane protein n=1 Tax=Ancylomarina sp. 16SWW S1-10-2 TaxID=2499681 RepID=UPI00189D6F9E|nr:RagB/SusD family nutrient uptake outer membrane protein [Ancylomarina sp. 16SWW S1-10-2]